MKKILIPVKDKITADYEAYPIISHQENPLFLKEVSEEEYLISKLIRNQELEQNIFNYFANEHDIMLMEDDFNSLQWIIQEHLKQKQ